MLFTSPRAQQALTSHRSLAALSDGVIHYRLQLSIFGAISLVYAVTGTNNGIYSKDGAYIAMAVGWLVLAIVDVSLSTAFRILQQLTPADDLAPVSDIGGRHLPRRHPG